MTIREIINQGKLETEVDKIKRYSAVNVGYITNYGREDETQLDVSSNILTDAGIQELEELFGSLAEELATRKNKVTHLVVVASAGTKKKLEEMGF